MKVLELIFLFNRRSQSIGTIIKLMPPDKIEEHTTVKTTVNELGLVVSTNSNQEVNGVSVHYTTGDNAAIALVAIAMLIDITTYIMPEGRNKILEHLGTKDGTFIKDRKVYHNSDGEYNYMFMLHADKGRGLHFQLSIQPQ